MATRTRRLRLLSLDGGGVRGLVELIVLKRIMHNLRQQIKPPPKEILLPCDYFDIIAGTSTGGLIAVMLGILRMDVDSCIKAYLELSKEIFPHENFVAKHKLFRLSKALVGSARFDAKVLEKHIKALVRDHLRKMPEFEGKTDEELENTRLDFDAERDPDGPACKVFVCTFDKSTERSFRLRNYTSREPSTGCTIWQALRATSAAPLIFDSITFGDPIPAEYADGGVGMNNPIRAIVDEAEWLCTTVQNAEIGCILSIGTGVSSLHSMGDTAKDLADTLTRMATETETTANWFKGEFKRLKQNPLFLNATYFRFNVSRGIGDIPLEEWQAMMKMNQATNGFMSDEQEASESCALAISHSAGLKDIESFARASYLPVKSYICGRDRLQQDITDILQTSSLGGGGVVLWGLPGFGKTQLALHHAFQNRAQYDYVLWIDASSPESQLQSVRQIERKTCEQISQRPESSLNPFPIVSQLIDEIVGNIARCISSNKSAVSLMVIDGVDQPNTDLRIFMKRIPNCKSLITTTRYKVACQLESAYEMVPIEVRGIDEDDAVKLLLHHTRQKFPTANGTKTYGTSARRCSPRYRTSISNVAYSTLAQSLYDAIQNPLRKCRDFQVEGLHTSYEKHRSIFASLDILYAAIQNDKDALKILQLSTFFGHGRIPCAVHSNRMQPHVSGTEVSIWLRDICSEPSLPLLAISQLRKYCLVRVEYDSCGVMSSYELPNIIRHWVHAKLSEKQRRDFAVCSFSLLGTYLRNSKSWDIKCQPPYFNHILSILRAAEKDVSSTDWQSPNGSFFIQSASIAHIYGRFCFALGQYQRAKQFLTWTLDYDRLHPEANILDQAEVIDIRLRLGTVCWKLRDFPEALEFLENVTTEATRFITPDQELAVRSVTELRRLRERLEVFEDAAARARLASNEGKLSRFDLPPTYRRVNSAQDNPGESSSRNASPTAASTSLGAIHRNHNGTSTPMIASPFLIWKHAIAYNSHDTFINSDDLIDLGELDILGLARACDGPGGPDGSPDGDIPAYEASLRTHEVTTEDSSYDIPISDLTLSDSGQLPRHIVQDHPMSLPQPSGKSDEIFEKDVISTLKAFAASRRKPCEVIIQAMTHAAAINWDFSASGTLWLWKYIVIYRLANAESNFHGAKAALSSWFATFERLDNMVSAWSVANHMSLSHSILSGYLRAESRSLDLPWLLHEAVRLRLASTVQYLLASGADANAPNSHGWTPFMIAVGRDDRVASEERRHVVIKHLMDYGASPTLDLAIQADDYRLVDFLMCVGGYRDEQDGAGNTIFHRAAESMDTQALDWLLAYGADPSLPNADGYRPLHFAVQSGSYETVKRLLCDFKADPSVQDNNGVTALHLSTRHRDLRIVFLLLYIGARKDYKDSQGLTPAEWAKYLSHNAIETFILQYESSRPYAVDERFITTLGSLGPVYSLQELQIHRAQFELQIAGESSDDEPSQKELDAASARKTLIKELYSETELRVPPEHELERRLRALRD